MRADRMASVGVNIAVLSLILKYRYVDVRRKFSEKLFWFNFWCVILPGIDTLNIGLYYQ